MLVHKFPSELVKTIKTSVWLHKRNIQTVVCVYLEHTNDRKQKTECVRVGRIGTDMTATEKPLTTEKKGGVGGESGQTQITTV